MYRMPLTSVYHKMCHCVGLQGKFFLSAESWACNSFLQTTVAEQLFGKASVILLPVLLRTSLEVAVRVCAKHAFTHACRNMNMVTCHHDSVLRNMQGGSKEDALTSRGDKELHDQGL